MQLQKHAFAVTTLCDVISQRQEEGGQVMIELTELPNV